MTCLHPLCLLVYQLIGISYLIQSIPPGSPFRAFQILCPPLRGSAIEISSHNVYGLSLQSVDEVFKLFAILAGATVNSYKKDFLPCNSYFGNNDFLKTFQIIPTSYW